LQLISTAKSAIWRLWKKEKSTYKSQI